MQASTLVTPTVSDNGIVFVAIELSQKTWLVTLHSPDRDRISRHKLEGGDHTGLLRLIEQVRARVAARLGSEPLVVSCYEAGYDGFWLHRLLKAAGITPVAVHAVASASGLLHARVALPQPSRAREAIAALFAIPFLKHVYVVDEDVDVFSDDDMEWAMANRFRADRDFVVAPGQMAFPMDVTAGADRLTTKAGFDLTGPLAKGGVEAKVARPPRIDAGARFATVEQALASRPMHFTELMAALGSKDGREIVIILDKLREQGAVTRGENGEWSLQERA